MSKSAPVYKDLPPRPTGPLSPEFYPTQDIENDCPDEFQLIGTLLDQYVKEHAHRAKSTRYQSEHAIHHFLKTVGLHDNMPIQMVDRAACQKWKASLLNQTEGRPRKMVSNQVKLKALAHFTKWLQANDIHGFKDDPMKGLPLAARVVTDSKTGKEGFTETELRAILAALGAYKTDSKEGKQEFYWLILALTMTGARLTEILQLAPVDVRTIEGVPCFDIRAGKGQRLKNKMSARIVPLHSQLIEAGFLDMVHERAKQDRLFPILLPSGVPLTSRWFADLLKRLKIKRPEVSTNSLRHSFAVALERAQVPVSIANRLQGHAIGKDIHSTTYLRSLKYGPMELRTEMEKVRFPL